MSHRVRRAVGLLLLLASLTVPAAAAPDMAQQLPEPPFYAVLPHDYPYPLIRVCSTPQGMCAVPVFVAPASRATARDRTG